MTNADGAVAVPTALLLPMPFAPMPFASAAPISVPKL
jgi:hypothetical protein